MKLYKISDRHPDYRKLYFSGGDLKGMAVYSAESKKVGRVVDLFIDEADCIKYLAVRLNSWLGSGKTVLLPVSRYAYNSGESLIYVHTLNKAQIKKLPEYDESRDLDDAYAAELQQLSQGQSSSSFSYSPLTPPAVEKTGSK
jgi:sporulation protein YlmC with PRC-barrel domain